MAIPATPTRSPFPSATQHPLVYINSFLSYSPCIVQYYILLIHSSRILELPPVSQDVTYRSMLRQSRREFADTSLPTPSLSQSCWKSITSPGRSSAILLPLFPTLLLCPFLSILQTTTPAFNYGIAISRNARQFQRHIMWTLLGLLLSISLYIDFHADLFAFPRSGSLDREKQATLHPSVAFVPLQPFPGRVSTLPTQFEHLFGKFQIIISKQINYKQIHFGVRDLCS